MNKSNKNFILNQVDRYYSSKIKQYGPTPKGVDWNSSEAQEMRFRELSCLINHDKNFSILDYGCGYGAFLNYLLKRGFKGKYFGYDISTAMIKEAKVKYAGVKQCYFTDNKNKLKQCDYVIASGLFNVCQTVNFMTWTKYVLETIDKLFILSKKGLAFNSLTKYSDPGKTKEGLYYADPEFIFTYCKHNFSKKVALLHDYDLYEFTILIRK